MKRILTLAAALATFFPLGMSAAAAVPGDLDPTFGSGGKVVARIGSQLSWAETIVIQPDGKIVVGGAQGPPTAADWGFGLARFNRNGSLDTSFGSGGTVTMAFGTSGWVNALALQPDGKIVAAGWTFTVPGEHFALARFNPDGSLDPSFGDGGRVTTDFITIDEGNAVVVQPDEKIVVAGQAVGRFALARYGRIVTTDFDRLDTGHAVVVQPDGTIVVAGESIGPGGPTVALARYRPDGSLDPAFGSGGKVRSPSGIGAGTGLARQPDGKLVVSGTVPGNPGPQFALLRFDPDGAFDALFGWTRTVPWRYVRRPQRQAKAAHSCEARHHQGRLLFGQGEEGLLDEDRKGTRHLAEACGTGQRRRRDEGLARREQGPAALDGRLRVVLDIPTHLAGALG